VQSVLELAARVSQLSLILSKISSVPGDFLVVIADLLPISKDFLFAGPVADIPAKLGSILSQLFEVTP
jgi:hypothetical protein